MCKSIYHECKKSGSPDLTGFQLRWRSERGLFRASIGSSIIPTQVSRMFCTDALDGTGPTLRHCDQWILSWKSDCTTFYTMNIVSSIWQQHNQLGPV